MSKASTLIKPYLKKFILQTHPDFFQFEKVKKQTNAASLQKLNNLLQSKSSTKETSRLQFFTKQTRQPISIEFDSKGTEWDHVNSFLSLCQKLNISILPSDMDIVQTELNKQQSSKGPKKTLAQEFADELYKQQRVNHIDWTTTDILNNPLIQFDPSINKKKVAARLCKWLPYLQPDRWWNKVPLMIISPENEIPKKLSEGIMIIYSDMKLEGKSYR